MNEKHVNTLLMDTEYITDTFHNEIRYRSLLEKYND